MFIRRATETTPGSHFKLRIEAGRSTETVPDARVKLRLHVEAGVSIPVQGGCSLRPLKNCGR